MRNSRGYVGNILSVNGKGNTVAGKALSKEVPEFAGIIQDINWSFFDRKEIVSISKMKLKKFPELVMEAKKVLAKDVKKPVPTNKVLTSAKYVGPEPV